MPTYITGANTGYMIVGTDIAANNGGLVTKEYILDVYPSLSSLVTQAGLWAWGLNSFGSIGDGTTVDKSSPVQTISGGINWKQVAGSAGIKSDGTLWSWGIGSGGQLGDNTVVNRSSPVQTVAGGTNWKQLDTGNYIIGAVKTDGTLWVWGINTVGNLGDTTRTHRSSPIQTIAGGTNWKSISTGKAVGPGNLGFMMGLKTDGTLWVWGRNSYGQLGDNTRTHRSSPIQTIAGGATWEFSSAGGYHSTAIKTDSTLWAWGLNSSGQLGDNTVINRSSPVQTVAGGTNWKTISAGSFSTLAIKTDGTLWTWGYNAYGQLGDNTLTHRSSPVQTVAGGTNWKFPSAGLYHAAAIKTDGTLWVWGHNFYGQLGDGTGVNRSSPVQTISGGTNWKSIEAFVSTASNISGGTAAIRDDSDDPV